MKKRKLKRSTLLLLALTLTISLSSCGKKQKQEKNENASSSRGISIEIPPVSIDGTLYGVVMEADEKGMTVQSDKGEAVYFQLKKTTDLSALSDGIKPGKAVKIKYAGNLNIFGTDVENIEDSDREPKLPEDALKAASEVILAFHKKDSEKLKDLCSYPLLLDRGKKENIRSGKGLTMLSKEDLFTEKLTSSVTETNLFLTNLYENGLILGKSKPNLILQKGKKGWKITAIHYK